MPETLLMPEVLLRMAVLLVLAMVLVLAQLAEPAVPTELPLLLVVPARLGLPPPLLQVLVLAPV